MQLSCHVTSHACCCTSCFCARDTVRKLKPMSCWNGRRLRRRFILAVPRCRAGSKASGNLVHSRAILLCMNCRCRQLPQRWISPFQQSGKFALSGSFKEEALAMRAFRSVICRRLVNTYTCAHVRVHVNFVSRRSLTAQDPPLRLIQEKVRLRWGSVGVAFLPVRLN